MGSDKDLEPILSLDLYKKSEPTLSKDYVI